MNNVSNIDQTGRFFARGLTCMKLQLTGSQKKIEHRTFISFFSDLTGRLFAGGLPETQPGEAGNED